MSIRPTWSPLPRVHTLRMQLWPEHATVQTGQPRKNWNGQMAELTDRILAAADSLVQEHQQEWRHWEEVAQSQAVAMVLAEVEAQASVDTHERRHAETETAPGGTAPGNTQPRKIWRAPELTVSCEKCSYCGLSLRRDSVHRHLTARILSGAPLPRARGHKAERALATMRLRHIQEEAHRRDDAEVAPAEEPDRPLVGGIPDFGPIPCGTKIEACPHCGLHMKKQHQRVCPRLPWKTMVTLHSPPFTFSTWPSYTHVVLLPLLPSVFFVFQFSSSAQASLPEAFVSRSK